MQLKIPVGPPRSHDFSPRCNHYLKSVIVFCIFLYFLLCVQLNKNEMTVFDILKTWWKSYCVLEIDQINTYRYGLLVFIIV